MKRLYLNDLSDEELMVLYQNGTEMAFRILYERHSSKIFGFLKKRVKKEEKVAEIYQEVFIKIHRSKHLYNKTLPLLPWLFTVTRSVMLDEFKKDKNFKYADNFDLEKLPAAAVSFSDRQRDVNTLIQNLPENQKIAVQMRYMDDKTFEEIAQTLKTTPVNVRQILGRGLKHLKDLIGEGGQS